MKFISDIFFPLLSFIPETSVIKIIFSALRAEAIKHATLSPLIFKGFNSLSQPIGEITGILFLDALKIIFFEY